MYRLFGRAELNSKRRPNAYNIHQGGYHTGSAAHAHAKNRTRRAHVERSSRVREDQGVSTRAVDVRERRRGEQPT